MHSLSRYRSVFASALLLPSLLASLRAADFYVDGTRGQDTAQHGTTLATPWKTIHYALSNMPVPTGANGHTLHIVGGQTYSAQTNGERFPLRPLYNVAIQGYAASNAGWPKIVLPSGATGFRFDPAVNYERNAVTFRYMKIEGGRFALDMGGTPGKRHRPRIWQCEFRGQSESCARITTRSSAEEDARFALCVFEDALHGISGFGNGNSVKFQPDIDECVFRRLRGSGFRVIDNTAGQSPIGGLVQNCQFEDVQTGVYLESGRSATNTLTKVTRSRFRDCGKGVHVHLRQTVDPTLTVEDSSFDNCGSGVYFDGRAGLGPFVYTLTNNRFVMGPKSTDAAIDYRVGDGSRITLELARNIIRGAGRTATGLRFAPSLVVRQLTLRSVGDDIRGCATAMHFAPRSSTPKVVVQNAILADNNDAVLVAGSSSSDVRVVHSTLADNDYGMRGARVQAASSVLFSQNRKQNVSLSFKPGFEHCCFGLGDQHAGSGNVRGAAGLLRPSYKLASDSLCIDAGSTVPLSPSVDFEGDPRAATGKQLGNRVPDIGADEYVYAGSMRAFGIRGYANRGVHPAISGSGDARIGGTLRVGLTDAADIFGQACDLALLNLATTSEELGLELTPYGAPLSYLYGGGITWLSAARPDSAGRAWSSLSIPNDARLVGGVAALQWLVHAPWLNELGFVTSDGLRVTIGR